MTQPRASAAFLNDPDYELNRSYIARISDLERRLQAVERQEPGKMISTLSQASLYMPNLATNASPSYVLSWDSAAGLLQKTALTSVSRARAYANAQTSIANAAWTAVALGAEQEDTDSYHSTSTNTSRMTVPTTDWYLIIGQSNFVSNTTGNIRGVSLRVNGGTYIAAYYLPPIAGGFETALSVSVMYPLTAGQYVEMCMYQDSGGALNTTAFPSTQTPALAIYRL